MQVYEADMMIGGLRRLKYSKFIYLKKIDDDI